MILKIPDNIKDTLEDIARITILFALPMCLALGLPFFIHLFLIPLAKADHLWSVVAWTMAYSAAFAAPLSFIFHVACLGAKGRFQ